MKAYIHRGIYKICRVCEKKKWFTNLNKWCDQCHMRWYYSYYRDTPIEHEEEYIVQKRLRWRRKKANEELEGIFGA